MTPSPHSDSSAWLRLLPPSTRWAGLLALVPVSWQARLLEAAMRQVLAGPTAQDGLLFLDGRRLGIEVSDLRLRFVVTLRDSGK